MISSTVSIPIPSIKSVALMIHEVNTDPLCSSVTDLVVTRHPVLSSDGKARLGAGQGVSLSDLTDLLALVANRSAPVKGLLPINVLGQSSNYLCWYVPGSIRPMWFLGRNKQAVRYTVPWPNLIFKVNEGALSVASYKGCQRPKSGTRLYHAPIGNVYNDARVCTGNATIPSVCGVESMSDWESVIFDTMFTHVNHENTLVKPIPSTRGKGSVSSGEHLKFWKKLVKATHFPNESLVSFGKTLKGFA